MSLIIGSSGRRYAHDDLVFAGLVQGRIAIVLDNTGLSRAAARSEAIMSAALDSLEEAVTMNGPDGATVYVNQAAVRLLGAASAEEVLNGEPGAISARYRIYDEDGRPYDYRDLPAFRALDGEPHPEPKLVRNVVVATGEERWLLNKVSVLRDADGGVDRIVNVIEDVTEVKNAEVRQRILAEATSVLSAAPDREQGLAGVVAVLVPDLADWSAVDVDGPAASAGREPAAGDERIVVGLRAGGGELGTLTLGRARPFSGEDRTLAEELGRRAAIAVLDARLSEERAEITRELQEGLRPPELPPVPGLRTATLYRPAGELNDVGGDFYDAFPTAAGWTVCIGDVAGQGARAATLTGLMRYTLRSVAQHTGGQESAMAAVNRALTEQPELALGTLAVVRLHRGTGGDLALASLSAGHPLPLLIRDGAVHELGAPGPIAGVFADAAWPMTDTPLQQGDTIVLYTDGVLDTVGDRDRFGDERLLALLAGAPADPDGRRRPHRRGARGLPGGPAARRHGHRRDHRGRRACDPVAGVRAVPMPTAAILDIDGTLVDTNYQHAMSWYMAFRQHGVVLPITRIHRHIGMGGDQLVAAVAGEEVERRCGDDIRAAEGPLYLATIQTTSVLEGARELIEDLVEGGRKVVLASSAKQQEVDHYLDLLDARELVDGWTTSADVERTKPEPDLVHAALEQLGTDDAVMVGDTPWDVQAAEKAGVPTVAVLTGGFSEAELTDAGAAAVFSSIVELRKDLASTPLRS